MENKDHDMVITIRWTSDQPAKFRRFSVHYKLITLIAGFWHDVTDLKYKGDYQEFAKDMCQLLIGEVKSRVVSRQGFTVWFYSELDMKQVLDEVCNYTKGSAGLERYGDKLTENSAVVPVKQ